jgi:ribokinase
VDVFFLNQIELQKFCKETSVKSAIKKLQDMGLKGIVLKLGKKGSVYYSPTQTYREPAMKVKCRDSTGAGDVFNAGFVFGYLKKLNPSNCLKIGNFVAGEKIQHYGIVVPTQKEMNRFIKEQITC